MHEWTEFATAEIRYTLFPTPYSFIAIFILLWFFFFLAANGKSPILPRKRCPFIAEQLNEFYVKISMLLP